MYLADENKKCVLDVSMSSRRERRLIHKLAESHQLGENISAHNNTEQELIDEVIGTLDPTNPQYVEVSIVPNKNQLH